MLENFQEKLDPRQWDLGGVEYRNYAQKVFCWLGVHFFFFFSTVSLFHRTPHFPLVPSLPFSEQIMVPCSLILDKVIFEVPGRELGI